MTEIETIHRENRGNPDWFISIPFFFSYFDFNLDQPQIGMRKKEKETAIHREREKERKEKDMRRYQDIERDRE